MTHNILPGIFGVGAGVGARVCPGASGAKVVTIPGARVRVPVICPLVPVKSQ